MLLPANENPTIGIKRSKVPYKKKATWTDRQVFMFISNEIVRKYSLRSMKNGCYGNDKRDHITRTLTKQQRRNTDIKKTA